jgi:hypothetical protein
MTKRLTPKNPKTCLIFHPIENYLLWKILALRSLQIPRNTSKAREAMALRFIVAPLDIILHHSKIVRPIHFEALVETGPSVLARKGLNRD